MAIAKTDKYNIDAAVKLLRAAGFRVSKPGYNLYAAYHPSQGRPRKGLITGLGIPHTPSDAYLLFTNDNVASRGYWMSGRRQKRISDLQTLRNYLDLAPQPKKPRKLASKKPAKKVVAGRTSRKSRP